MNHKDRNRLARLNHLLSSVPLPVIGGATQSAAVSGFVTYAKDMSSVYRLRDAVILGMCLEGRKFELGWDYADPDRALLALEAWIVQRQGEGWQRAGKDYREYKDWAMSDKDDGFVPDILAKAKGRDG